MKLLPAPERARGPPIPLFLLFFLLLPIRTAAFSLQSSSSHLRGQRTAAPRLRLVLNLSTPKKPRPKGVYARPSAAIEKGSGFFVPGFEGSRVRILFSVVIFLLNYVNTSGNSSGSIPEFVVQVYGVLLLLLGVAELGPPPGLPTRNSERMEETTREITQSISSSLSPALAETSRWISATYVSLTPATHVLVVINEEIVFSLGDGVAKNEEALGACLEALRDSTGNRIALPGGHPGVRVFPEGARNCVLVQGFRRGCLLVGSGDVLKEYGKGDLRWLGVLAKSLEAEFGDEK